MRFINDPDTLVDDIPSSPEIYGNLPGLSLGIPDLSGLIPWAAILAFLTVLWNIYTILAYIFSILMLILFVYATVRWNEYLVIQAQGLRDEEALYDEYYRGVKKHSRLDEVFAHSASENPNDWKLAIIEADIILDSTLKDRGYQGVSLGERLRSITPMQLSTIDDAWEAHKVRNKIAHEGADFILTKRVAEETVNRYQRVFSELGVS